MLKPDGIMTLMFTHKATGAWDALASGLMEAGFTITASWPINTEAEGSLHIKDKSAANSTIFLVCRPRRQRGAATRCVLGRRRAARREGCASARRGAQAAGIVGVDLYLSCFGPALEEFAKHWPLKRGTPRVIPARKRKAQESMFGDRADPYAVTPEDALDAARREVKQWRLEKLLRAKRQDDLDPLTEWFVLAWDAFRAPQFPYDEALRLARVVGWIWTPTWSGSWPRRRAPTSFCGTAPSGRPRTRWGRPTGAAGNRRRSSCRLAHSPAESSGRPGACRAAGLERRRAL